MSGEIKDWHNPHNDACEQNQDIEKDCTCKLHIPKRKAAKKVKPRILFRVCDHTVGRRTNPNLFVELYDDGRLRIRERKRRVSYETTVGKVYNNLVWRHAMQVALAKKKERADKKAAKTKGRRK